MHTTISRSSKSKPPAHSRMFHLSLAIYTVTIIVFEAKARYVHWTSESTHYGHHLRFVVIIQSWAHRTTLYLLKTRLVDQLNAPCGTSSVASHYLTTIGPTCRLVSTLHLDSYKILARCPCIARNIKILWEKRMNKGMPYLQVWRGVWVSFCKIAIVSFLSVRYKSDGLYCRMAGTPSSTSLFL